MKFLSLFTIMIFILLRDLLTYDRHLFVLMQLQAALLAFHPLIIIDYSLLPQRADETEAISSMVYQLTSLILEVHSTLNNQKNKSQIEIIVHELFEHFTKTLTIRYTS